LSPATITPTRPTREHHAAPRVRAASAAVLLAVAAALLFALLAPGSALADEGAYGENGGEGAGGLIGSSERPQLMLIHGGSFLYDDPTFEPLTRGRAIAAGFVPHYVTYPLDSITAAVQRVREEARRLREKFGLDRVYAYGASAGGTLVALLSGQHLVSAAVAKAPVSDLATWEWPTGRYGPEYWTALGADQATRERLSPALRPEEAPLLVIQGRADNVVPPSMNEAFAARFNRVKLWLVAGGHTTERVRPFLITRAMQWLARQAARKILAKREAEAPPEASPEQAGQ
jgi:pimeloyl-ACP methyl ester carboxylesterase